MVFTSHNPSVYQHKDNKLATKLDKLQYQSSRDIELWCVITYTAADCPPRAPYCWTDDQHCHKTCRSDADCPGAQYCGLDKQCHEIYAMKPKDIYVNCDEWSDCTPWMKPSFCWMDMMRCGRYCRYNSECAAANEPAYCWRDQGACYNECRTGADCHLSPGRTGSCDKDSPADQYGVCIYHGIPPPDVIHCDSDTDCPKKQPYCWMDQNECSKYCRSSEDCPDKERCEGDGQCYTDSTPPHKKGYI